jgi:hypothetical protein
MKVDVGKCPKDISKQVYILRHIKTSGNNSAHEEKLYRSKLFPQLLNKLIYFSST